MHTLRLSVYLSHRQLEELDSLIRGTGLDREEYLVDAIHNLLKPEPHLHRIKLRFERTHHMATPGPITLTSAGQTVTATVVGYDQFGNVFTGTIPTPTFTSSDSTGAFATFDASTGLVTAVANGVVSITATVTATDAAGAPTTLTDTETVTIAIPVVTPPTPVLSSIKVQFS